MMICLFRIIGIMKEDFLVATTMISGVDVFV